MTIITDETTPQVNVDYSPGYSIDSEQVEFNDRRYRTLSIPNASTGSANLVSIDINDKESVDELNDKYPLAWEAMYPGEVYSYYKEDGTTNALRMVKAVELWMYLNNFEYSDAENLSPTNLLPTSSNNLSYSDYLNDGVPFRVPPETMWNREIFYNDAGQRVDSEGRTIPDIYVDDNGSPIFRNYDIGTREELNVLGLSLVIAKLRGTLPESIPQEWFDEEGELAKPITEFTEQELQTVRDANVLFTPQVYLLPYSPFTLHGTRVIASKVAGKDIQRLYSKNYMAKTEYESTLGRAETEYEWGGPYATGSNTF